jgi:hypothetical protein
MQPETLRYFPFPMVRVELSIVMDPKVHPTGLSDTPPSGDCGNPRIDSADRTEFIRGILSLPIIVIERGSHMTPSPAPAPVLATNKKIFDHPKFKGDKTRFSMHGDKKFEINGTTEIPTRGRKWGLTSLLR